MKTRSLTLFWGPCIAVAAGCGQSDGGPMTGRDLKVITDHDAWVHAIDVQDTIRFFQPNPPTPSKQPRQVFLKRVCERVYPGVNRKSGCGAF